MHASLAKWRHPRARLPGCFFASTTSTSEPASTSSAVSKSPGVHFFPAAVLSHEMGFLSAEQELSESSPDRTAAADMELLQWEYDWTTSWSPSAQMQSAALFLEDNNAVLRRGLYVSDHRAGEDTEQGSSEPRLPRLKSGEGAACRPTLSTRWSGKWKPVCSAELKSEARRVVCRKGGKGSGGWWSPIAVMSHEEVSLLQVNECSMTVLQEMRCSSPDELSYTTAIDVWGDHGTMIGHSNGRMSLIDWREDVARKGPALHFEVPQPPWLRTPPSSRRGRRLADDHQTCGVLSCCSLDTNFRAVAGLGDSQGTVVVFDVRQVAEPSGKSSRKRLRSVQESVGMAAVGSVPTSSGIISMHHCPTRFGTVGMMDSNGAVLVTTVAELEHTQASFEVVSLPENRSWSEELSSAYPSSSASPLVARPSSVLQRVSSPLSVWNRDLLFPPSQFAAPHQSTTSSRSSRDSNEVSPEPLALTPGSRPSAPPSSDIVRSSSIFFESGRVFADVRVSSSFEVMSRLEDTDFFFLRTLFSLFSNSRTCARPSFQCTVFPSLHHEQDVVMAYTSPVRTPFSNANDNEIESLTPVGKTTLFRSPHRGSSISSSKHETHTLSVSSELLGGGTAPSRKEKFTCLSSLDNIVCFHSDVGNTVCVQL